MIGSRRTAHHASATLRRQPKHDACGIAGLCFVVMALIAGCSRGDGNGDGGGDGSGPNAVNLSLAPDSVMEGDDTATVTVTATLAGGTSESATEVAISVAENSAGSNDFSAVPSFAVTIDSGATSGSADFSFAPTDDDEDEENETVSVTGTAAGLTVNPATLTIVDNDEPSESGWVPGQFLPDSTYAGQCLSPRLGVDPRTGRRYPDVQGQTVDENNWLRSWSNYTYLWYDEVIDRDPGRYDDPLDYFDLLRTTARTASGARKDRFHFTYDTDVWIALSQSGRIGRIRCVLDDHCPLAPAGGQPLPIPTRIPPQARPGSCAERGSFPSTASISSMRTARKTST